MSISERLGRAAVPLWAFLLAVAVCAPLFARGYVLSYDMVWVPHLDLQRSELWGLESALPRAVPSDAFSALLGAVLPAMLVQKALLLGSLILAGLGADRLIGSDAMVTRLAAVTLSVWNPFVAERLVLGQWPLLIAYAGLFWLIAGLVRDHGVRWPTVALALAATALTPATGLMGVVVGVIAAWRRASVRVLLIATSLNLPWIVASLLQPNPGQSDPSAVALFDVKSEGSLGRVGSALTLGGIWNSDVVPTSRTLGIAVLFAVLIAATMLLGIAVLYRRLTRLLVVLVVIGGIGISTALSGWLFPDAVAWTIRNVPGGGIIRDGTRWLALLAPLEVVAFGSGVGALSRGVASWRVPAALLVAALPIIAMPDLGWGVGGKLEPVSYPAVWAEARDAIAASTVRGDVVSLPFSAYRAPSWNDGRTVIDPAGRFFDRTTVTNDELTVGGTVIAGEDPRAAAVARALALPESVPRLAALGIGLAVVDTEAPGAEVALAAVGSGTELNLANQGLRVFVVPDAEPSPISPQDRWTMVVAWAVAGSVLGCAIWAAIRSRRRLDLDR